MEYSLSQISNISAVLLFFWNIPYSKKINILAVLLFFWNIPKNILIYDGKSIFGIFLEYSIFQKSQHFACLRLFFGIFHFLDFHILWNIPF